MWKIQHERRCCSAADECFDNLRRTTFNQTRQTDFFGWLWRRNDGFSLTLKQRSRWHKMNCGWCCEFILWLFTRGRWKCRWRQITCFSWILFQEFCFFPCGDFFSVFVKTEWKKKVWVVFVRLILTPPQKNHVSIKILTLIRNS